MGGAQDRIRWEREYQRGGAGRSEEPDAFVVEALGLLGPGAGRAAVDLACGGGRHALELARRGWRASAWDASPSALELVRARAEAAGVAVAARAVDLEGGRFDRGPERFELALVVNFLDRGLLAAARELLRPGGHLLFATFTVDRAGERPRREWCLERGELARGLPGFETVLQREAAGRAGLLARLAVEEGAGTRPSP